MPPRSIDALGSPTLKHLRDNWWTETFTTFLKDTLQPRAGSSPPGRRMRHGDARGPALTAAHFAGLVLRRRRAALAGDRSRWGGEAHNIRARTPPRRLKLPFGDGKFDSTFCIAVLQHVRDVEGAVAEMARVTKPGGRVLAVEPDNRARYWYSSVPAGMEAFELANRLFSALAEARGDATDPVVGPRLPAIFAAKGIEPSDVQLFPVTVSRLGKPPRAVWTARRSRSPRS